jgi:hypothetical protein
MNNENISGVTVFIQGVPYTYEAHSFHKVAEILAGHLGEDIARIDSFEINYFKAVN